MDEPTRPVFLSREQRDDLEADGRGNHLEIAAAWDAAPADAWAEIADEFGRHRCKDPNCFTEFVMLRLGGIQPIGIGPFDAPATDAP